jgi:hypothetical protein
MDLHATVKSFINSAFPKFVPDLALLWTYEKRQVLSAEFGPSPF